MELIRHFHTDIAEPPAPEVMLVGKREINIGNSPDIQPQKAEPFIPTFPPRFWHSKKRLDARPIIWSLKNKPEDWRQRQDLEKHDDIGLYFEHKPSAHIFRCSLFTSRLQGADCPCRNTSRKFQFGQHIPLLMAFGRWGPADQQATSPVHDWKHFEEHFTLGKF